MFRPYSKCLEHAKYEALRKEHFVIVKFCAYYEFSGYYVDSGKSEQLFFPLFDYELDPIRHRKWKCDRQLLDSLKRQSGIQRHGLEILCYSPRRGKVIAFEEIPIELRPVSSSGQFIDWLSFELDSDLWNKFT